MNSSMRVLSSLMVALFVIVVIPGSSFGDGPWDIDNGGGSETQGGTLIHDRTAVSSSSGTEQPGAETLTDGPSLVTSVTYSLLYQLRLTSLAESILVAEFSSKYDRLESVKSKTRR